MSDIFFFKDEALALKPKPIFLKEDSEFARDEFEFKYTDVKRTILNDEDLYAMRGSNMVFDVECFSNFFMIAFRMLDDDRVTYIEQDERKPLDVGKLRWIMENFCMIGFNSNAYDIPMIRFALRGSISCKRLHEASGKIIGGMRSYKFEQFYKLPLLRCNHIDIIEVAPLQGSLKLYSGRLHAKRMQDLPVSPNKVLTEDEKERVKTYCFNDIDNTVLNVKELSSAIELRAAMSHQYHVDLRSKSDAQIAEAVINHELREHGVECKRPELPEGISFKYKVPDFISYRTDQFRNMLEIVRGTSFELDENGYLLMPDSLADLQLDFGGNVYRMGMGGLHSSETSIAHIADDDWKLIDRDVASYYPSIILNQQLYPKHLGPKFLTVYKSIVDRRLKAKKEKNKIVANSLKITINGSFGKFGSKWSTLYSPDLLLQTTITGQLALLMLIEMVEDLGELCKVVSANTDGIVIKCHKSVYAALQARVAWWEALTHFETEETAYSAIFSRDVNNYLAIKAEGGDAAEKYLDKRLGVKAKGCYSERGSAGDSPLSKNPDLLICNDAVVRLIAEKKPIEQTIRECNDIRRFCMVRNVSGGANKSGQHLGKVIRWYYSTRMKGVIVYNKTGNKVPMSDGAMPMMELPEAMPPDVDFDKYIAAAQRMVYDLGIQPKPIESIFTGPLFGNVSIKQ